jgi:predicted nuclease of predicted toxin-antitoxin system
MKLLFDNNISYRIVKMLAANFPDCIHATRTGLLMPAPDTEIWRFARQNGFAVVTNDEDFVNLENLYGFPPKIIHLRFGNAKTLLIAEKLTSNSLEIIRFLQSTEQGVLEIF